MSTRKYDKLISIEKVRERNLLHSDGEFMHKRASNKVFDIIHVLSASV